MAAGLSDSVVHAAQIDIATTPIGTSTGTQVQPNVMFVLDASGSMERDYVSRYRESDHE